MTGYGAVEEGLAAASPPDAAKTPPAKTHAYKVTASRVLAAVGILSLGFAAGAGARGVATTTALWNPFNPIPIPIPPLTRAETASANEVTQVKKPWRRALVLVLALTAAGLATTQVTGCAADAGGEFINVDGLHACCYQCKDHACAASTESTVVYKFLKTTQLQDIFTLWRKKDLVCRTVKDAQISWVWVDRGPLDELANCACSCSGEEASSCTCTKKM
mmetsp:Transcript_14050/g.43416  ORF Transcript_14050/g.43416 Transcript_14050/m.43416 type:complete len:219 (+) Transcript_14050:276-932(+)